MQLLVGLICYDMIVFGVVVVCVWIDQLCVEGVCFVIVDVLLDCDFYVFGEVCVGLLFVIGGLGIVFGLFVNFCCVE